MNSLCRMALSLATVLAFGLMTQACAFNNNCDCPDNGQGCDQDVVADTGEHGEDTVANDVAEPDDTAVTNDFLTGTAAVSGKITLSNMTDNSGVTVFLSVASAPYDRLATAVTAADGTWSIEGIPAGLYTVTASGEGYTIPHFNEVTDIELEDGETFAVPDMTFAATGRITGRAWYDGWEGWPDENAEYDSGIMVYLPGREMLDVTDDFGNFALDGVLPGTYRVCAGYVGTTGSCHESVTVAGLKTTEVEPLKVSEWDIENPTYAHVTGKVLLAGQTDHSGTRVEAWWSGSTKVEATTDAQGVYDFPELKPGFNFFSFHGPDGSGFETDAWFDGYELWGGVTELMPTQYLGRGEAVVEIDRDIGVTAGKFSQDSRYLVYKTGDNRLLAVDLQDTDGPDSTFLAANVDGFEIAPDASFVLYTHSGDSKLLYTVPMTGGDRKLVTSEYFGHKSITPDSAWVLFGSMIDDLSAANPATGDSHLVCRHAIHQSAPLLSQDLQRAVCLDFGGWLTLAKIDDGTELATLESIDSFHPSAVADTVVACSNGGVMSTLDMVTGTVVQLQGVAEDCQIVVTATAVVYLSDEGKLMSTPLAGGEPVLLVDDGLRPLAATPDFSKVVAYADSDDGSTKLLYSVDAAGGSPIELIDGISMGTWSLNMPYSQRGTRAHDVGYVMGRNSDVIYLVPEVFADGGDQGSIHRVRLDGTADDILLPVASLNGIGWEDESILWDVNEEAGYAIATVPGFDVGVYNIATGVKTTLDAEGGAGDMAPDGTGLLRYTDLDGTIEWYNPADLSSVSIAPAPLDLQFFRSTESWQVISPDSKHVAWSAPFGRAAGAYMDSTPTRVHVVDLD